MIFFSLNKIKVVKLNLTGLTILLQEASFMEESKKLIKGKCTAANNGDGLGV